MVQEAVPVVIKNDRICVRAGDIDLRYGADRTLFHFQPAEAGEIVCTDQGTGGAEHGVCIQILTVLPQKTAAYHIRVRSGPNAVPVPLGAGQITGMEPVRRADDPRNGDVIRKIVIERFQQHGILGQDLAGANFLLCLRLSAGSAPGGLHGRVALHKALHPVFRDPEVRGLPQRVHARIGASGAEHLYVRIQEPGEKRLQLSLDRIVDPGLLLPALIPGPFILNGHLVIDLMHLCTRLILIEIGVKSTFWPLHQVMEKI